MNNYNRSLGTGNFLRRCIAPVIMLLVAGAVGAAGLAVDQMDPQVSELWDPVPVAVTPGQGGAPPSDAIVLFDGSDTSAWEKGVGAADGYDDFGKFLQKLQQPGKPVEWQVKDGSMTVNPGTGYIKSKQAFGNVQLHVEWKSPTAPLKEGQDRGNSGIFLQGLYEVQILDSYQHQTYSNGQAAAVYKQVAPLVNASLAPGKWQIFDIIFTAPVFGNSGTLMSPARVTVIHNGVLVQNNVSVWGPTTYRGVPNYRSHPAKLPLVLQDHNELVSYRNIWVREL